MKKDQGIPYFIDEIYKIPWHAQAYICIFKKIHAYQLKKQKELFHGNVIEKYCHPCTD